MRIRCALLLIRSALLLAVLCAACGTTGAPPPPVPVIAIAGVTVIDGTGAPARPNMTVIVAGDRIEAVGAPGTVHVPAGARRVDGRGKYLIPGLWDMHVHLSVAGESALPLFLAHGVTSVRDLGSRLGEVQGWKAAIANRSVAGPRIFTSGPILESARWLEAVAGFPVPVAFPFLDYTPRIGVASRADALAAVDSLAAAGVDLIKVRTVASADVMAAISAQAQLRGLPFAAHAPTGMDAAAAAALGLGSLEHIEGTTFALGQAGEAQRLETFREVARHGTMVVPTILAEMNWRLLPDSVVLSVIDDTAEVLDPRRRRVEDHLAEFWRFQMALKPFEAPTDWQAAHERAMADLRLMHAAGVTLVAGTDLGAVLVYPGSSLHDELVLLVERIGMTPLEALQSATRHAAGFFGLQHMVGTIEPGKLADLVLLDADPLHDIRNTRRITAVLTAGRYFDRAALDALPAAAR
jgi:imidazolonepropionase-like amidohydrolase